MVLSIVVFLAVSFTGLIFWTNENYHNEATQRLHQNLAQYIIDHQYSPLIEEGLVNQDALKKMAEQTMAINPLVEVYLLDSQGEVLGHALPSNDVKLNEVNISPIKRQLLSNERAEVIVGDNPRDPIEKRIFSAAPIMKDKKLLGYLYVLLNSELNATISEQVQKSYIIKLVIAAAIFIVILSLLISLLLLRRITKPLRQLSSDMQAFQQSDCMREPQIPTLSEIPSLKQSFYIMKDRILKQFNHLQENNRLRKELISNISHDLRTPLASMQGYIEALLLKRKQISEQEQKKYLTIAHRNSRRLSVLVSELFDLSKLEARQVTLEPEPFSLLELTYDVVQDFELDAEKKSIAINIKAEEQPYKVTADIGLMQRVLQNLIDNALRFTPKGGSVTIQLNCESEKVMVSVADSGVGIKEQDLPYIFDAYYSSHSIPDTKRGTGLGLAIVKHILELHGSEISVKAKPNQGTRFSFGLVLA